MIQSAQLFGHYRLTSMDEVIQKSKDELAKWQELKKGLLQQMFV